MVTRHVRPNAAHLPGGTGTGDGLSYETAYAGMASVPNGLVVDDVAYYGTFLLTAITGFPAFVPAVAGAKILHRGGSASDPAVFQVVGNVFLNVNRSNYIFDKIKFIGDNGPAIYLSPGVSNIDFLPTCEFVGTKITAAAVIRFDDSTGNYNNISIYGKLSGTAFYGVRWLVWGTVTTVTTLKNITIGVESTGFVSGRSVIQLRIDPGAAAGCRMENIRIYGGCRDITGIAYEIAAGEESTSAGFQFNAYIDGTTPVTQDPQNPKSRLGGGLAVGGFARIGEVENRIDGKFTRILGVTGAIDTFWGDYALGDIEIDDVRSEPGFIDGSAIIADVGTYRLVQVGKIVVRNVYGDKDAPSDNYAGGMVLTILQATGVKIDRIVANTVRMGVGFGNPIIPLLSPIASMTASGNVVTVNTTKPHNRVVGEPILHSKQEPPEYSGTYPIASIPSPTSYTVVVPTAPLGNATKVGTVSRIGAQSSTVRELICNDVFATAWLMGVMVEYNGNKMDNNVLEFCWFRMRSSKLPLFVQYAPGVVWNNERNNFYHGSRRQDPYGRYKVKTSMTPSISRRKGMGIGMGL